MANTTAFPSPSGEGPGAQTRDGCSVQLYLRLPYREEIELLKPWIVGADVLELGCAVGRLTKHLLEQGYRVTSVDNSPEMLAHVPDGAVKVCSNIEDLALDATFDAVILASNFINVPAAGQRAALLAACHRHLRVGGRLLFERHDPTWLATATVGPVGKIGEIEIHIDRLERHAEYVAMSVRYRAATDEWRQHFAAQPLTDEQVCACLVEAKFEPPSWINQQWGYAVKNAV